MMTGADWNLSLKRLLWPEPANTATDYDNYYPIPGDSLGSEHKFWGKGYKSYIDSPKIFGEACIVTNHTRIKAKLADRGKPCMWMGFAKNHKAGTYRLYNQKTNKLIISRDVTFIAQNDEGL